MLAFHIRGRFALGALLLPVLLFPVVAQLQQCDEVLTVDSTETASDLSDALMRCEGGTVVVDWIGRVVVEEEIHVAVGTSLNVSGRNLSAAVDGNGTTALFTVDGATLNIEDMILMNGFRVYFRGGLVGGTAIRANGSSSVHLSGTTVFEGNEIPVFFGGAVRVEESALTWTGNTTFLNNTADAGGGAISCSSGSSCSGTGTTSFQRNSAQINGGAVHVSFSNFSCVGTTSLIDNSAPNQGGALYAQDESIVMFSGTTYADGNSAATGGAFRVYGDSDSDVPTGLAFEGNTYVVGNVAEDDGGGLAIYGNTQLGFGDYANTTFSGNSAGGRGGAVFANAIISTLDDLQGLEYVGVVFEFNSAEIGGAIASYGSGGALRLNGDVSLGELVFEGNRASSAGFDAANAAAGPAVSNLGTIASMQNVTFIDNTLFCSEGTYMDYVQGPNVTSSRYSAVCTGCLSWGSCFDCKIENAEKVPETCTESPDGTFAAAGATLETLEIERGWYRATTTTTNIFACYNEDACLGGQTGDEHFCADGYMGPYCAVCEPGFSATLGFRCSACSGSRLFAVLPIAILLCALVLFLLRVGVQHLVSTEAKDSFFCRRSWCRCCNHSRPEYASFSSSLKIVIVVWQIVTQFSDVANVAYPETFERFLRVFDLFNLDLGFLLSAGCLWTDIDFHDRLLMVTLWPLGTLAMLWATYSFTVERPASSAPPPLLQP